MAFLYLINFRLIDVFSFMKSLKKIASLAAFLFAIVFLGYPLCLRADPDPAYWQWAPTPPMGWNSYDAYNDAVNEEQVLANAQYVKDYLLAHGWNYVVIDFRWYDPEPTGNDLTLNQRTGAKLPIDSFGRVLPAPNRFPSAADGNGFKALADKIHAMGLKFGFHMMRGIPRESVAAKTPIENSAFTAADAGDTNSTCSWCPDMYGVRNNEAGQAWYDSMYRLYASWGLDFVKVDDLSNPYHKEEIEMIRKALDKCGRPIVFSTSPGETDIAQASNIEVNANMWRISGDFWDNWGSLDRQFDLLNKWHSIGAVGPGHYPDADMIPFGYVASQSGGPKHTSRFTHDEETTLMSLWSLASSPLMRGGNLPQDDDATLALMTNDEVIALDQDPLAKPARRVAQANGLEVWVKDLKDGSKAIGLFNRSNHDASITLDWKKAGLSGEQNLRDLWQHKDLGSFDQTFSSTVPSHGVILLQTKP
jgi:alpha-galactosidase